MTKRRVRRLLAPVVVPLLNRVAARLDAMTQEQWERGVIDAACFVLLAFALVLLFAAG